MARLHVLLWIHCVGVSYEPFATGFATWEILSATPLLLTPIETDAL